MKTAVSIPEDLFERANLTAQRLQISRSELFARALERYLQQLDDDRARAVLDEVYGNESSELPPGAERAQASVAAGWDD